MYVDDHNILTKTCHAYFLGLLTGGPEEEVGSFSGNLLKELTKMHERARKAMKSMVRALWSLEVLPESMAELASHFKGARRRFELWKKSACREGACEAWAMVKSEFTKLEPKHMARVGPVGPDGQEIPLSLVYEQVIPVMTHKYRGSIVALFDK